MFLLKLKKKHKMNIILLKIITLLEKFRVLKCIKIILFADYYRKLEKYGYKIDFSK